MHKLLYGRRHYALACLVAVGGLVTAAASCEPVKAPEPVKEPAPTGLSIDPTSHDFGTDTGVPQTFTVKNNGPNTSGALATTLTGTDEPDFLLAPAGSDNTCAGNTLAADATCIVKVRFTPGPGDSFREAELVVNSDNPDDGEAVATLTGTPI
jgi:hypothetical protein